MGSIFFFQKQWKKWIREVDTGQDLGFFRPIIWSIIHVTIFLLLVLHRSHTKKSEEEEEKEGKKVEKSQHRKRASRYYNGVQMRAVWLWDQNSLHSVFSWQHSAHEMRNLLFFVFCSFVSYHFHISISTNWLSELYNIIHRRIAKPWQTSTLSAKSWYRTILEIPFSFKKIVSVLIWNFRVYAFPFCRSCW